MWTLPYPCNVVHIVPFSSFLPEQFAGWRRRAAGNQSIRVTGRFPALFPSRRAAVKDLDLFQVLCMELGVPLFPELKLRDPVKDLFFQLQGWPRSEKNFISTTKDTRTSQTSFDAFAKLDRIFAVHGKAQAGRCISCQSWWCRAVTSCPERVLEMSCRPILPEYI